MRNEILFIARFSRKVGIRWHAPFANIRIRYRSWIDKGLKDFYKMIEHHKR